MSAAIATLSLLLVAFVLAGDFTEFLIAQGVKGNASSCTADGQLCVYTNSAYSPCNAVGFCAGITGNSKNELCSYFNSRQVPSAPRCICSLGAPSFTFTSMTNFDSTAFLCSKKYGLLCNASVSSHCTCEDMRPEFNFMSTTCTADPGSRTLPGVCNSTLGSGCTFYSQCVESISPCGSTGYAVNYGEKYCSKFNAANFSDAQATRWRDNTLTCLQKSLFDYLSRGGSTNCGDIRKVAFDSHPPCYTTPGNSVCDLITCCPADVFKIVMITRNDLVGVDSFKQIWQVIKICSAAVVKEAVIRLGVDGPWSLTSLSTSLMSSIDLASLGLAEHNVYWLTAAEILTFKREANYTEVSVGVGFLSSVNIDLSLKVEQILANISNASLPNITVLNSTDCSLGQCIIFPPSPPSSASVPLSTPPMDFLLSPSPQPTSPPPFLTAPPVVPPSNELPSPTPDPPSPLLPSHPTTAPSRRAPVLSWVILITFALSLKA